MEYCDKYGFIIPQRKCEEVRSCETCLHNDKSSIEYPCNSCIRNYMDKYEKIPKQTNADRIRNMDDMELAGFLFMHMRKTGSVESVLEWLQKEVEE